MQIATTKRLPECMKLYIELLEEAAMEVLTQGAANEGEQIGRAHV
jgi:hypothetical protein